MATAREGTVTEINRKLRERGIDGSGKKKGKDDAEVALKSVGGEPVLVDGELPGMETEKIPELIRAAKSYNAAKKARMAELEKEVERKAFLLAMMNSHGLKHYKFGKLTVDITSTDSLKVKEEDDEE